MCIKILKQTYITLDCTLKKLELWRNQTSQFASLTFWNKFHYNIRDSVASSLYEPLCWPVFSSSPALLDKQVGRHSACLDTSPAWRSNRPVCCVLWMDPRLGFEGVGHKEITPHRLQNDFQGLKIRTNQVRVKARCQENWHKAFICSTNITWASSMYQAFAKSWLSCHKEELPDFTKWTHFCTFRVTRWNNFLNESKVWMSTMVFS